jgi:hypothetical protein
MFHHKGISVRNDESANYLFALSRLSTGPDKGGEFDLVSSTSYVASFLIEISPSALITHLQLTTMNASFETSRSLRPRSNAIALRALARESQQPRKRNLIFSLCPSYLPRT